MRHAALHLVGVDDSVTRHHDPHAAFRGVPDDATTEEVQSQYAIGIATLVIGTLVLAAIVVGALYVVARRTWTVTH